MGIDIETYYRTYGPMVLRRCRTMLRDEETARDAMHDVFVQVLRRQDRLHHSAPSSLLFRVATNVCLNKIRSRGRRPEQPDDDLIARIAAAGDAQGKMGARSSLRRLFGSQPESSATIATLYLHDGMTLEQVATEVGMSVSGVRKRLRSMRAQLAELEGV